MAQNILFKYFSFIFLLTILITINTVFLRFKDIITQALQNALIMQNKEFLIIVTKLIISLSNC